MRFLRKTLPRLDLVIAQLRHLYDHMVNGNVSPTGIANAARGLLGPEIRMLEEMQYQEVNGACAITSVTLRLLQALVAANVLSSDMARSVLEEMRTGEGVATVVLRLGWVREDGRYWIDALHYMAELEAKVVSSDAEVQNGLRLLKEADRPLHHPQLDLPRFPGAVAR